MLEFKVLKKSKKSKARLGVLKTKNGIIETPCFVPVATQASVKTLDSQEINKTKTQVLIINAFHLHLKPGEDLIKKAGGLHSFMNCQKPLMTDSGGFQVFSLGFGKDFGIGKILKSKKINQEIKQEQQPNFLKINYDGVVFRSFIDGRKIFLGPKESIQIQEKLGADIIFAFDECTSPIANYQYTKKSLTRTHKWAEECLRVKSLKMKNQSMFGVVQGGRFRKLRIESAKFIAKLPFNGFGIGGEFGNDKNKMMEMLSWVNKELPEEKPRHLLGVGYLRDIVGIIERGIDLFDCNVPTHYARRGIAFTSGAELNFKKKIFLKDKNPLDKKCFCYVCQNYKRNYIAHLFQAKEITAFKLLTFHNLYFFNSFVEKIRNKIKNGL